MIKIQVFKLLEFPEKRRAGANLRPPVAGTPHSAVGFWSRMAVWDFDCGLRRVHEDVARAGFVAFRERERQHSVGEVGADTLDVHAIR